MTDNNKIFTGTNADPFDHGELTGVLVPGGGDMEVLGLRWDPKDKSYKRDKPTTDVAQQISGIHEIKLIKSDGKSFEYTIFILGGSTGRDTKLTFTLESGDTHVKRIYKKSLNAHSIDFNSDKPNVVKVAWEL